ncbi:hypothetical protein MHYP_G00220500 [Metynnis hypsauchen]
MITGRAVCVGGVEGWDSGWPPVRILNLMTGLMQRSLKPLLALFSCRSPHRAAIFGLFVHHTVALFKVYQHGGQTRGDGEEDEADMGHECYLTEWTSKVALCRGGGEVIWSLGLDVCQRLSLSVPHCKLSHRDLHLIGAGTQDRPQPPDRWTMARAGLRGPGEGYALHVSLIS